METTKLTKRQSFWLSHYNQCREEKTPFEHYCKKNNLSGAAFGHARKKLAQLGVIASSKRKKRNTAKPGFVTVKARSECLPAETPMAQILLPDQICIHIPMAALEQVLPTLLLGGQNDQA